MNEDIVRRRRTALRFHRPSGALAVTVGTLAVALAALGGCDSGPSGADSGIAIQSGQFDTFVGALAQEMCGWQFRCCSLPEIDMMGQSTYLDETECRAATTRLLTEQLLDVRFAAKEGRLTFDETVSNDCLSKFTKASCNVPSAIGAPPILVQDLLNQCASPFSGSLPVGAACFLASECQQGSSCYVGASGPPDAVTTGGIRAKPLLVGNAGTALRGRCQRDVQEGGGCLLTTECAPGLYCRRTDFLCARPSREGESCLSAVDDSGNTIAPLVACADAPLPVLCVNERCRHLPRNGEPCMPPESNLAPCDPTPSLDLTCVGQGFNGNGICKKRAALGEVCFPGGGGLPDCAGSLTCAVTVDSSIGTCKMPPKVGESCAEEMRCTPPAVCYEPQQMCVIPPKVRAGAICQSDLDCASLRCVPSTSTTDAGTSGRCVNSDQILCAGPGASVVQGGNPPTDGGGSQGDVRFDAGVFGD